MTETIVGAQQRGGKTAYLATDPDADAGQPTFWPVTHLHRITPYGMLLTSLATCTASVVHAYAGNHGVDLDEVTFRIDYERTFKEDCENCEGIDRYDEAIVERISFKGDLSDDERDRLFGVAHQCPIHKMFESGIAIDSQPTDDILGAIDVADVA